MMLSDFYSADITTTTTTTSNYYFEINQGKLVFFILITGSFISPGIVKSVDSNIRKLLHSYFFLIKCFITK